jgi:hypothetical protein
METGSAPSHSDLPKWKKVLLSQDWSLVPLFVVGICFTLLAQVREPAKRDILLSDPSIANAYSSDSVHYIVAFMAPFACLVGSVVVCEYIVHRKSESTTAAIAATIHFLGTSITMFFTVIAITEVIRRRTASGPPPGAGSGEPGRPAAGVDAAACAGLPPLLCFLACCAKCTRRPAARAGDQGVRRQGPP